MGSPIDLHALAETLAPVRWEGDARGALRIVDQTRLPLEERHLRLARVEEAYDAIVRLAVRGAPAIGVAGAYAVVLGLQGAAASAEASAASVLAELDRVVRYLTSARPTAVNLAWAVGEVASAVRGRAVRGATPAALLEAALGAARHLDQENRARCDAIGHHGEALLRDGDVVYTHCNAGPLATGGIGTALGVVFAAVAHGKRVSVVADETRPLLQGARLTAYECLRAGVPVTLVTEGMASRVMETRGVTAVVVGADRIAANGDTANKIGTCTLAIVARHYGVPFYVAAPLSTFDRSLPDGGSIPIEERSAEEVTQWGSVRTAPQGVPVFNPAFDVTPAALITGIVTEAGLAQPPNRETVAALFR